MRYFILLILIVLMTSCEKELDFKYHEVDSQIVIEGAITQQGASVLITETTPMDEKLDLTPVTDADVVACDLNTGERRILYPNESGYFADDIPGEIGHEYRINVSYRGKSFEAECEMKPASQILGMEFQWIKMPYDYVAVLQVSFTDSDKDDDCYWIRLYRNEEPYMWIVSDDRRALNGVISEVVMTSRKDLDEEDEKSMLKDGDVVSASVAPISRSMYDYLNAIQADSNGPQMFTGDFCLGYFLAAPISVSSIEFKPDEMEEFKKPRTRDGVRGC